MDPRPHTVALNQGWSLMHVIAWNRLEKPDAAEAKLRLCPKISFGTKIAAIVFLLIFGIPAFETHPVLDILFLSVTPVGSLRIRKFCAVGYLKMFEAWLGRTFDPVYDYTIDHDYTNILFTNNILLLHIINCGLWLLYYLRLPCEGAWKITGSFIISCILLVRASLLLDPAAPTHQKAWFWFKIWHYNQERNGVTSFKWIAIQDWLVLHSCGHSRTSRKVRSKLKQV